MVHTRRRKGRGAVMAYFVVALIAFTALVVLAVDLGHTRVAKTQLQGAVDAAARYGALGMADGTSVAKAIAVAAQNTVDGTALVLQNSDVVVGTWSGTTFTAGGTNPNAVRVTGVRSAARGTAIKAYFGGLLGIQSADVQATATAIGAAPTFGIVGISSVKVGGQAVIGSYYSSAGGTSYSTGVTNGIISSNGAVSVSGTGTITGDVKLGPGGSYSGSASAVSGSIKYLSAPIRYPSVSAGPSATANNNGSIPSGYMDGSRNINLVSGQNLTLPAGTYYLNNVSTTAGGTLSFSGPTTLYLTGSLSLAGHSLIGDSDTPSDLQINMCSSASVSISGTAQLYAQLYAPQSNVTFSGSGIFAGSLVALNLDDSGGASIYYDRSGSPGYIALVQ